MLSCFKSPFFNACRGRWMDFKSLEDRSEMFKTRCSTYSADSKLDLTWTSSSLLHLEPEIQVVETDWQVDVVCVRVSADFQQSWPRLAAANQARCIKSAGSNILNFALSSNSPKVDSLSTFFPLFFCFWQASITLEKRKQNTTTELGRLERKKGHFEDNYQGSPKENWPIDMSLGKLGRKMFTEKRGPKSLSLLVQFPNLFHPRDRQTEWSTDAKLDRLSVLWMPIHLVLVYAFPSSCSSGTTNVGLSKLSFVHLALLVVAASHKKWQISALLNVA